MKISTTASLKRRRRYRIGDVFFLGRTRPNLRSACPILKWTCPFFPHSYEILTLAHCFHYKIERGLVIDNNMISRREAYEELLESVKACKACRDRLDPSPVIWGNIDARIMQISQAPSLKVHQTQRPFNDASGVKLRREWYQISDEMFYDPYNFYIASIGRCYPGKTPGGSDRKPPRKCADLWLGKEMELVNNELYILIGGCAAAYFFPKENFSELVFRDLEINGRQTFVLPHPSPANRRWFLKHPEFMEKRVCEVGEAVRRICRKKPASPEA